MIGKYGRDAVLGGIAAIMDHSEAATRARVREIPDGVYEAESFMDDDGVRIGERIPIRVRVEVDRRPDEGRSHRCLASRSPASTIPARPRAARAARSRSSA